MQAKAATPAPRLDVFIANDRHHAAMTAPVLATLQASGGYRCRVLSLCELRGLVSPPSDRFAAGVEVRRVLPFRPRPSPATGRPRRAGAPGRARRSLRALAWPLLARRLAVLFGDRPNLVLLPNDAAFPYDRIAGLLRRRGVPFLLLQEGIRFPIPALTEEPAYGAGGAAAIAAWGEASADYFRAAGAPAERIHLTGNPRFDRLAELAGETARARARARWGLPARTLLLVSNPIDDQGFCSHHEKMALVRRFVAQIEPLFADPEFHLAIKLHGREAPEPFRRLIGETAPGRISLVTDEPLWELLGAAGAAIVLASTVGLEALLVGLPLAVLELPGHGFQYDYVQSGAAVGLPWSAPMAPAVAALFAPPGRLRMRIDDYLQRQLATRHDATQRVARLIRRLLAADG